MRHKAGPSAVTLAIAATAAVAMTTLGKATVPGSPTAFPTSCYKNCTLYSVSSTKGTIQCYVGSWRAQAQVGCERVADGRTERRSGPYADVGKSTAACLSGWIVTDVYAHYNQGSTVKPAPADRT